MTRILVGGGDFVDLEMAEAFADLVLEAAFLRMRDPAIRPRWADVQIGAAALLAGTYVVSTNKRHFNALGVPAWNYEKERRPPET